MMVSQLTEGQALDMGITEAAIQQAREAAIREIYIADHFRWHLDPTSGVECADNCPGQGMACGCEHENHFDAKREESGAHGYLMVPAGSRSAQFVGKVCDLCAETCMVDYLI